MSNVHDVLHVSQLKKCLRVPEEPIPMEQLDLGGHLVYSERPIRILDTARASDSQQSHQDVQGSVESPNQR
jgi:hypothetical protein